MDKIRYRFIRPQEVVQGKPTLKQCGGICLMFESCDDGSGFNFSYAWCPDDEPFSKTTAIKIAQARLPVMKTIGAFLPKQAVKMIVPAVRLWCKDFQFELPYQVVEFRALGDAIEKILTENEKVNRECKSHSEKSDLSAGL